METTSYSALSKHRQCPKAWEYQYVQRLREAENSTPVHRDFGTWWHALRAADSIERGTEAGTLKYAPESLQLADDAGVLELEGLPRTDLVVVVLDAADKWWQARPREVQEAWLETLGQTLPDRLVSMHTAWQEQWGDDIAREAPIAVEVFWDKPLPSVAGEGDPQTQIRGRIDEVYLDRKRNLVVARDYKTGKSLDRNSTLDDLLDSQLPLYAWGILGKVKEWGHTLQAVSYDRARSIAPKPPVLTKSGKLAQRGGEPSVASCDLATYLTWVQGEDGSGVPYPGLKKDGSGAGLYTAEDKVVQVLSTPIARARWFQRTLTPLSAHVVREHVLAAAETAIDVSRTRLRIKSRGSAARNFSQGCKWCPFSELCRDQLLGGPGPDYDLSDYRLQVVERGD